MNTSISKLVYVKNTPASVRDELLNYSGAYSLDDAVQIDMEDLRDAINGDLSQQTFDLLVEVSRTFNSDDVIQFI